MNFIEYLYTKANFHNLQGYALYFYQNGEVFEKCQGKLSEETSGDITFNSNFRLASVTKQFIAFGIVKLINNGLLQKIGDNLTLTYKGEDLANIVY